MTAHVPILVGPIVSALTEPPFTEGWIVDCTLGGGGHTAALLDAVAARDGIRVLSVDQDAEAVERGRARFERQISAGRLEIIHSRFGELDLSGRKIIGLMADLGFSSDQLEDAGRGVSFQSDGPLDMRLDPSRGRSARELLAQVTERELEKILVEFGEERFARRIASAVVSARRNKELPSTTQELVRLVARATPASARHGRIHVATRTFQALRIAVNDELGELDSLLSRVILFLEKGGRAAILSFHSLEDRRVKQAFKGEGFKPLTKKPLEADEEEIRRNPRSRSAKLRIAEKV